MLELSHAFSSFSVNDIGAARRFYGEKLGLRVTDALPGGAGPLWLHIGGEGGVLVYPKADHVPASFTVLNLSVRDIERAVDDLGASGIQMERYPEYQTDDRGIFQGQGHSIAWFKDPAGNGLSVVQETGANDASLA